MRDGGWTRILFTKADVVVRQCGLRRMGNQRALLFVTAAIARHGRVLPLVQMSISLMRRCSFEAR